METQMIFVIVLAIVSLLKFTSSNLSLSLYTPAYIYPSLKQIQYPPSGFNGFLSSALTPPLWLSSTILSPGVYTTDESPRTTCRVHRLSVISPRIWWEPLWLGQHLPVTIGPRQHLVQKVVVDLQLLPYAIMSSVLRV